MIKNLINPGNVQIDKLEVQTFSGLTVDLIPYLLQVSIMEDIFSPALAATITLNESMGLLANLPIVGFENVRITWRTSGRQEPQSQLMRIYSVGNINTPNPSSQMYTLQLISIPILNSEKIKISRAYDGKISETVRSIFTEFIQSEESGETLTTIEETHNAFSFKTNYWNPIYAISWISQYARSASSPSACNYVFYQSLDGFKFISIDAMNRQRPVAQYTALPGANRSDDNKKQNLLKTFYSIDEYKVDSRFNIIDSISRGFYSGSTLVVDPFHKNWKVSAYSLQDDFTKTSHLHPNRSVPVGNEDVCNAFSSKALTISSPSYRYDSTKNMDRPEEWVINRLAQMQQANSQRVVIRVPGESAVRAGEVVDIRIPAATSIRQEKTKYDTMTSGKYLISSVNHIFSANDYVLEMLLIRDSYPSELPDFT